MLIAADRSTRRCSSATRSASCAATSSPGSRYVTNWYQIWVGQGYTAASDFAPLRHLWSLAVEEQFYLFWPLVMVVLILRRGRRRLAEPRPLAVRSPPVAITVVRRAAVPAGPRSAPTATSTPDAYWHGRRSLHLADRRALPGDVHPGRRAAASAPAFAMIWRPRAVMRGPLRDEGPIARRRRPSSASPCSAVLVVVRPPRSRRTAPTRGCSAAASSLVGVRHRRGDRRRHPPARRASGRVLGNPLLNWIGTRSLRAVPVPLADLPDHPQARRQPADDRPSSPWPWRSRSSITELSYRFVETPIRNGRIGRSWWRRLQRTRPRAGGG